ncbi:unnamed protein product [Mycena citricolor]|uniref:Autophagy-related protein n=1 Tax=Mycena citricolor TaxID=2018698 RepID=A0AAD2GVY1_9AGAR|nr:unnamed protein product [Mycena citricolor]
MPSREIADEAEAVTCEQYASSTLAGEGEEHPDPTRSHSVVSRRELWSYYLYWNGSCGIGAGFVRTLFTLAAFQAGYDAVEGPGSRCTTSERCLLVWTGEKTVSITTALFLADGATLVVLAAIVAIVSSAADYGKMGRWALLIFTGSYWLSQLSSIPLTDMISISYYGAVIFASAVLPRLARSLPAAQYFRARYAGGEISAAEFDAEESLNLSRISSFSQAHVKIGYLAFNCIFLIPWFSNGMNTLVIAPTVYWIILGIWWFVLEKPRPGPAIPQDASCTTVGIKQMWRAIRDCKVLSQTFIYLASVFVLTNGIESTVQVVESRQFRHFIERQQYGTIEVLVFVQTLVAVLGTIGFWRIQKYRRSGNKTMLGIILALSSILPAWGKYPLLINLSHPLLISTFRIVGQVSPLILEAVTQSVNPHKSFRTTWEFWVSNVLIGIVLTPYNAYSITMMAELTPPGFENMFFGLFGLSAQASRFLGPLIRKSIFDWNDLALPFLSCVCGLVLVLRFVGVQQGRQDARAWADRMRPSAGITRSN